MMDMLVTNGYFTIRIIVATHSCKITTKTANPKQRNAKNAFQENKNMKFHRTIITAFE